MVPFLSFQYLGSWRGGPEMIKIIICNILFIVDLQIKGRGVELNATHLV